MSTGLSPCPHCGGNDIEFRFHMENKNQRKQAYGGMYCRTEGCGGAVVFHAYDAITMRQARKICTEKWNRRYKIAAAPEMYSLLSQAWLLMDDALITHMSDPDACDDMSVLCGKIDALLNKIDGEETTE